MIQQQLGAELKSRELETYQQNMQLKQQNAALAISVQKRADEVRTFEEREQDLSQVLQSIALELPQCNIEFALPVPQKLRRVADRAKALEETMVRMDEVVARMKAEHEVQITELEARIQDTSQADQKARVEALRLTSAQMQSRIDEARLVLTDATNTWAELDEPPEKVEIQQSIQQIENTAAAMKEEIKGLAALQKMRKTKEMNCLQQEAQQLRTKEMYINDLLQPYQEQIAEIVDTVEQKMKEFTTTREKIDTTEDASISQALLESAQESVEVMQKEVTGLRDRLQRASQEAKEKLQQEKPAGGGSRASHK